MTAMEAPTCRYCLQCFSVPGSLTCCGLLHDRWRHECPTCRYGLETAGPPAAEAEQEGTEAAEAHASQDGGGSGTRHLSAKERKLLKKVKGLLRQPSGALIGWFGMVPLLEASEVRAAPAAVHGRCVHYSTNSAPSCAAYQGSGELYGSANAPCIHQGSARLQTDVASISTPALLRTNPASLTGSTLPKEPPEPDTSA